MTISELVKKHNLESKFSPAQVQQLLADLEALKTDVFGPVGVPEDSPAVAVARAGFGKTGQERAKAQNDAFVVHQRQMGLKDPDITLGAPAAEEDSEEEPTKHNPGVDTGSLNRPKPEAEAS